MRRNINMVKEEKQNSFILISCYALLKKWRFSEYFVLFEKNRKSVKFPTYFKNMHMTKIEPESDHF